jgi:hypothetical protein
MSDPSISVKFREADRYPVSLSPMKDQRYRAAAMKPKNFKGRFAAPVDALVRHICYRVKRSVRSLSPSKLSHK